MSSVVSDTPTPHKMTSTSGKTGSGSGEKKNGKKEPSAEPNLDESLSIKNEPPMDIDDGHAPEDEDEKSNDGCNSPSPKIRLTPTTKLMPSPNSSSAKRRYACPYDNCTKSYGKSSHLRSHLTWHTGIKPFVCQEPKCGKGFTRSDELNRHIRTHTGEKPFECVQCTKKFSRSDHLTKHLATHAKQLQKMLEEQQTRQSPIEEDKKMYTESSFSEGMHFMAALIDNFPPDVKHSLPESENLTDEGDFQSIKIKLERPQNSEEYHVVPAKERRTAASVSDDDIPHSVIEPESTMVCPSSPEVKTEPLDDDVYMREGNANNATGGINVKKEVNAEPARPFQCNQCSKSFKRQDDLNRHARTHSDEKPYVCTECDRRFKRNDHLKKHLGTHTKAGR